jgi:hypothetical protein
MLREREALSAQGEGEDRGDERERDRPVGEEDETLAYRLETPQSKAKRS